MASKPRKSSSHSGSAAELRVIGGKLRGSKLQYDGEPGTRPMKDRVREAVFNLAGPAVKGTHAVDLFAGTGAVGIEAISRGAVWATFIERHRPTAGTLRQNVESLKLADRTEIVTSDTFFWARGLPQCISGPDGQPPWTVFCCPPYSLYEERGAELIAILDVLIRHAPAESLFIVEADERFDFARLPLSDEWIVRRYHPAFVGVCKSAGENTG